MYVCICNAITDKQIRAAAESGTTDLWGLQAELGVAAGCGSCMEMASEILAEYRRPARRSEPARDRAPGPQVYVPAIA
jgi:bacterioferritin-associated ferredoxin